jgi:hypothetical protein
MPESNVSRNAMMAAHEEEMVRAQRRMWDAQRTAAAKRAEISERFRLGEIERDEALELLRRHGGVG